MQVRWRDRRCQICGSKERLQAHHIRDKTTYPDEAYDLENGIALCSATKKDGHACHVRFHNWFMGGTQVSCDADDLKRFIKVLAMGRRMAKPRYTVWSGLP